MGSVRIINDDSQFQGELRSAGAKLVVVDFTAAWCGPCQRITPIFDQFSVKYSNAVFLKVDVDKCPNTALDQGVTAMPTFIFFRNRSKLGICQGADKNTLESKIQQFYGSGDTEDTEGSVAGHVRSSDNVYLHIFGMLALVAILYFWNTFSKGDNQ